MVFAICASWVSPALTVHHECLRLKPSLGCTSVLHGFVSFSFWVAFFLCEQEAEALYADMGHCGPRPNRLTWSFIVLPSLVCHYADNPLCARRYASADNIF